MSNSLKLSTLRSGFEKLRNLGHDRDSFEILGVTVELRTITREELSHANEYSRPLFDEAQATESTFALSDWAQATKYAVLGYAIMRLGDLDFNGVDYVEDDTVSPPAKTQKHIFVREILSGWEDAAVNLVYRKFQLLTDRAEKKAAEGLEFYEQTKEEELKELENRVGDLRNELGLPPLVERGSTNSYSGEVPSTSSSNQEPVEYRDLKERTFKPIVQEDRDPSLQEHDGYHYEKRPATSEPPEDTSGGHSGEAVAERNYSEEELEMMREHERLFQERQRRQEAVQDQAPHQTSTRPETGHSAPLNDSEWEPLRPETTTHPSEDPKINRKPRGNSNPNFYSPNKRPK